MKQIQRNFITIAVGIGSLLTLCTIHGAADKKQSSWGATNGKKPIVLTDLKTPSAKNSRVETFKPMAHSSSPTPETAEDEEIAYYMSHEPTTAKRDSKSPSVASTSPWKSLTSPSPCASWPDRSSPTPSGRCSSIAELQQAEQKLHTASPHESQFQSPDKLMFESFYKPAIIPDRYDKVSCGAATVQMALKLLCRQDIIDESQVPTFKELVDILQIKQNESTYVSDIEKFFRDKLNLTCTVIWKPTKTQIIDGLDTIIETSNTIPTIANTHFYSANPKNPVGHFVLLQGEDTAFVRMCDPWQTDELISYIPKESFYQTCETIIQITGTKPSCKSTKPVEKKQLAPQPRATSLAKKSEAPQPRSSSKFTLLTFADA